MAGEIVPGSPPGAVDIPTSAYKTARAAGNLSGLLGLVDQAATAICGLYGKSPSSFLRVIDPTNGLIDNSRPVFDDLCTNVAPLPPGPAPPYSGGQCNGIVYTVTVFYQQNYCNNGVPAFRSAQSSDVFYGPITSVTPISQISVPCGGSSLNGSQFAAIACRGGGTGAAGVAQIINLPISQSGSSPAASITSVTMTRNDGQPDSCGSPPISYPPPSSNPNDYTKIVPYPVPGGGTINIPVTIVPTFAPSPGIFRPEVNVTVGGMNVNFSLGGFTLSPTVSLPVNVNFPVGDPRSNAPNPTPIAPRPGPAAPPFDPTAIITRLHRMEQEIIDCCAAFHPYSPPPLSNIIATSLGSGQGGTFVLPPLTFRVDVQITTRPTREKVQIGVLSPDVLFAGWARFSDGATTGKRQAIDSVKTFFSPTERIANAFTYTLYTGYVATVIAFSVAAPPPAP